MAVGIVQHRAVVENALTVHRASQSSDRRGGIEPADGPRRALVATEGRLSLVRGDPEPLLVDGLVGAVGHNGGQRFVDAFDHLSVALPHPDAVVLVGLEQLDDLGVAPLIADVSVHRVVVDDGVDGADLERLKSELDIAEPLYPADAAGLLYLHGLGLAGGAALHPHCLTGKPRLLLDVGGEPHADRLVGGHVGFREEYDFGALGGDGHRRYGHVVVPALQARDYLAERGLDDLRAQPQPGGDRVRDVDVETHKLIADRHLERRISVLAAYQQNPRSDRLDRGDLRGAARQTHSGHEHRQHRDYQYPASPSLAHR